MKREEAIEILEVERDEHINGHGVVYATRQEAVNMAIKALQTEPCEDLKDALHIAQTDRDKWATRAKKLAKIIGIRDCDIDEYKQEPCGKDINVPAMDAISRQAAIEQSIVLRDISNPDKEWEVVTVATIKHLKSVQPEHRTGHWVEIGDEPYDTWECDNCGFVIDGSGCVDPEEYRDIYKYCPNCGSYNGG